MDPFVPARLGPIELRNRIIKAATFEGMSSSHRVSDSLIEFHEAFARGLVGLTTVAYCAVSPEGCGTKNEIVVTDETQEGFARLARQIHDSKGKVSVQLGHAGAVATAAGLRGYSPSPIFSPVIMRRTLALTRAQIYDVVRDFGRATKILKDANIDAVEVHVGHGYLLSEFLSPKLNRRKDEWGGDLPNRARLARLVLEEVREQAGDSMAVIAKLNMVDAVSGGLGVPESIEVAKMFEADGNIDALVLTAGSSLQNPMFLFRGQVPLDEFAKNFKQPLRLGFRVFGKKFFRYFPYEEAYLLDLARQFRENLRIPLVLLGGISNVATIYKAMDEGFEFVAMARALLREPDLIAKYCDKLTSQSACTHCNKCMPTIYTGTHCVLVDPSARPGLALNL